MASRTIENYLKQLYLEEQTRAAGPVPMGRLAAVMNVVPGTATAMVKALNDAGLVKYSPRTGVRLTSAGNQLALHVLRRHRLVELFLVKTLGLDWSEVHEEAEELEHVISDKVLGRIDALLGYPAADPHGDPIPSASGVVPKHDAETLVTCAMNVPLVISRVLDQEPAFLQFVRQSKLTPGSAVKVRGRSPEADAISLECPGKVMLTLSTAAGAKFLVKAAAQAVAQE